MTSLVVEMRAIVPFPLARSEETYPRETVGYLRLLVPLFGMGSKIQRIQMHSPIGTGTGVKPCQTMAKWLAASVEWNVLKT